MARHRAARDKPQYKKNLKRTLTIRIEGDDETLDRLATLLLFAQPPFEIDESVAVAADLPWPLGDAGKPDDVELQRIPPDVLRVEITKRLSFYIQRHGVEIAKNFLAEYGATKVSDIKDNSLRRFHDDLVSATPKYLPA